MVVVVVEKGCCVEVESGGGGKGFEVVVVVEAFESQGSLHFSVLVPCLCVCVFLCVLGEIEGA